MFRQSTLLVLILLTMITFYPQESDAQRKLSVDEVFTEVSPDSNPIMLEKDGYVDLVPEEQTQANASQEQQKLDLAEGWLVKMYSSPEDLKTIPNTEIASFVVNKSPYTLIDHRKTRELDFFKEPTAYLYEGYFNAKEEGTHTFVSNVVIPNIRGKGLAECRYSFWLGNEKIIDSGSLRLGLMDDKDFSKDSSISLQAGLHEVKQWIACDKYWPTEVSLRIKRPDSALPTLARASDFYHKVKE